MQRKDAKAQRISPAKFSILNKPERDRNSFSRCQAEPGDGNNAFRRDGRNIPATFRPNSGGIPAEFRPSSGGVSAGVLALSGWICVRSVFFDGPRTFETTWHR